MSDNLHPQYQLQIQKAGQKGWEVLYYDPDLDVMQERLKYQIEIQTRGSFVRLLGLKGENLGHGEGKSLDKLKKSSNSAE